MATVADLTGRGLAEALTSVDIHVSGEIYEVRPPTVREAIEISAISASVSAGKDHVRTLAARASTWLPPAMLSALLELDSAVFVRVVADLITRHARKVVSTPKSDPDAEARAQKKKAPETDFRLVIADYCQVYGGDPWTVYDTTPWPFLLSLIAVQSHATARDLLRLAEVEILPHSGKAAKAGIESLTRRAEGPGPDPTAPPETAPMDVVLAGRARIRAALGGG